MLQQGHVEHLHLWHNKLRVHFGMKNRLVPQLCETILLLLYYPAPRLCLCDNNSPDCIEPLHLLGHQLCETSSLPQPDPLKHQCRFGRRHQEGIEPRHNFVRQIYESIWTPPHHLVPHQCPYSSRVPISIAPWHYLVPHSPLIPELFDSFVQRVVQPPAAKRR